MSPRLLYLIGEPGVGKTATMQALTGRWRIVGELPSPARILFGDRRGLVAAVELGRRRPGGFSGTDALPMNAIDVAAPHLRRAAAEAPLLLCEGARLANRRFLDAAVAAGWRVTLAHLVGPEQAAARRLARGSRQNPSWVAGARTRADRLAAAPPDAAQVLIVPAQWSVQQRAAACARHIGLPEEAI